MVDHGSFQPEFEKRLDLFLDKAEKTSKRPSILKAFGKDSDNQTQQMTAGRNYKEIVLDDLMHMMLTVMRDVKDVSVMVPSYKKLAEARTGQTYSDEQTAASIKMEQKRLQQDPDLRQNFLPAHIAVLYGRLSETEVEEAASEWVMLAEDVAYLATDNNGMDKAYDAYGELRAAVTQQLENIYKNAAKGPSNTNTTTTTNESKNMNDRLSQLLENFAENLTEQAAADEFDEILYRSKEMRQTTATVMKDNNAYALCVGPAGSGKSAVVRGLANNIVTNQVPEKLKGAQIYRLKVRDMKATSGQGQITAQDPMGEQSVGDLFISRFHEIMKGVSEHNEKGEEQIIIDLDELATMGDRLPVFQARNVLAAAMSDYKHLRIIGEVNDVDFHHLQQEAPQMVETFQKVRINPLDDKQTLALLKEKVAGTALQSTDERTLKRITQLTNRFMPTVKQPGASLEVLDSASSYAELDGTELTEDHVIETVADQAGIPREFVGSSVSERIAKLGDNLPKMILGQDEAINKIIGSMKVANANLHDPNKPLGSFMLIGPTGVGKTETAKALAESLGVPLFTEDMGNYQDYHAKSKLIGSPPGYVGFNQEAALEKVARAPYSVLLLDEIEKAHGDILNILLSVLDEGRVQLMNGKDVDFKNCIVLMTSNLGEADAQFAKEKNKIGFNAASADAQKEEKEAMADEVRQDAIKKRLPPEFINRLDGILKYNNLQKEVARSIAKNKVEKVSAFLQEKNQDLNLTISKKAMDQLVDAGYDEQYGARPMDRAIKDLIKEPLAEWIVENGASITEPTTLNIKQVAPKFQLDVKKAAGATPAP